MELLRLDKLLATQGRWSRKEAKALIRAGQVMVNGAPAVSGDQKLTWTDTITVSGKALVLKKHLYIMMNKPGGVVCATWDPAAWTVINLLPAELRRDGLFPAGRLDKDTEGFVLITDDGVFAHEILSPRRRLPKTYYVQLDGVLNEEAVTAGFAKGVDIGGGQAASAAELRVLQNGERPQVEVTIYEGMYHQIKRMFARYSLSVLYLKRLQIGGLKLDPALRPGECRELTAEERALLQGK